MDADEHGCRVDANFAKDGEWVRSDLSSRNSSNPVSPPIAGLLVFLAPLSNAKARSRSPVAVSLLEKTRHRQAGMAPHEEIGRL